VPRYFTLAEAQSLVPQVEKQVRRAVSLKAALEEAQSEIEGESERVRLTGGALVDRNKLRDTIARRDAAAIQLRDTLTALQERGCLVKDLDLGLLDFPTRLRGEEVYLCWKLGEPAIAFWHGVDDGYRGRKPIDQDFLDHHRGES
jgi:hypothetical protein